MRTAYQVAGAVLIIAAVAVAVGAVVGSVVGSGSLAVDSPSPLAAPTFHVLTTGWGPFLNFTTNPSMFASLALDGTCVDADTDHPVAHFQMCFHGLVLPVNRTGVMVVQHMLENSAGHFGFDAILHMGLENSAKGLKLEVAAANFRANDTGGPSTEPAIDGAPFLQPTTAHLGRLEAVTDVNAAFLESRASLLARVRQRIQSSPFAGMSSDVIENVVGPLSEGQDYPGNVTDVWSRDAGEYVSVSCSSKAVDPSPLRRGWAFMVVLDLC
jgi:hypothetical protein